MHLSAHLWSLGCLIPLAPFWCILNVAEILKLAVCSMQWAVSSKTSNQFVVHLDFKERVRPASMGLISFVSFNHCSPVSLFMYSISIPIMIWVLSSAAEPLAISKNHAFSFSVDRPMPSAMFDGIERLERVIWSLNPKSFRFAIDR